YLRRAAFCATSIAPQESPATVTIFSMQKALSFSFLHAYAQGERCGVGIHAATIPSATSIIPLAKRVAVWKPVFDLARSPNFPPRQPNSEFVKNPNTTNAIPNVRIWALVEPALGSTNCGRNAKKNRAVFGFNARNPCRIRERFADCCGRRFPSIGLAVRAPLPTRVRAPRTTR